MKLTIKLCFFFLIFFYSCKNRQIGEKKTGLVSHFISITENENKGIKNVLAFYGGQCEYGIQKIYSTDIGKQTNFWLKLSKSGYVDSSAKFAELPASNIAYIFFKNLEIEKKTYTQIQSELIFSDESSMKFSYTISDLEIVKSKIKIVDKIVSLIKNKEFENIKNYLNVDTSVFAYNKDLLINSIQKAESESEFGNAMEFVPYGFKFSRLNNGKEILHITGVIKREKQDHYFSVNLDPNSLQDEIYSLDYQL